MINPQIVIQSALDSVINSVPSSISYYSQDELELRAAIINTPQDIIFWKDKILKTTGKKFLNTIGFTGKNAIFFQLAKEAANGNRLSQIKYENMKRAILEVAASGKKSSLTIDKAENIIRAANSFADNVY